MNWSTNEVFNLASKAARGGGAPPAQAAQFGKAALQHLWKSHDAEPLVSALRQLPNGPILDLPVYFMHLVEGAKEDVALGALPENVRLDVLKCYLAALPYAFEILEAESSLRLYLDVLTPVELPSRVNVPQPLTDLMQELAAKTYVPESEASRLSGAGAGLTDND